MIWLVASPPVALLKHKSSAPWRCIIDIHFYFPDLGFFTNFYWLICRVLVPAVSYIKSCIALITLVLCVGYLHNIWYKFLSHISEIYFISSSYSLYMPASFSSKDTELFTSNSDNRLCRIVLKISLKQKIFLILQQNFVWHTSSKFFKGNHHARRIGHFSLNLMKSILSNICS